MPKDLTFRSRFDLQGYFWHPDCPSRNFTARLTRTDKAITLTVSPSVNRVTDIRELATSMENDEIEILYGRTSKGKCTLLALNSAMSTGFTDVDNFRLSFREYRVRFCVFGLHAPKANEPLIESARLSYSGVGSWFPSIGKMEFKDDQFVLSHPTRSITLVDIQSEPIQTQIKIEICPYVQNTRTQGSVFEQAVSFILRSRDARPLEWFVRIGWRLENLLSLLLGTSVSLNSAKLTYLGDEGLVVMNPRGKPHKADPTIWVRCDAAQLGIAIQNWLATPEDFKPLESLIYGTIRLSSMFVETEFLSLAQAVESLHRLTDDTKLEGKSAFKKVLSELRKAIAEHCGESPLASRLSESIAHADEPSFSDRINRLLSRISAEHCNKLLGDRNKFEISLRRTRNFFTHPAIEKQSEVLTDTGELFLMNQKLHGLLRLLLLIRIGISEDIAFEPVWQQVVKWRLV